MEYQSALLGVVVREVIRMDIGGGDPQALVEWKLRATSKRLAEARCYTQAMWALLLAREVHNAVSVNVVWIRLRAAKSKQPPPSNRGVNLVTETIASLSDG